MANDKEQQSNQIDTPPKKSAIRKVGGAVQFTTITIPKKLLGLDLMKSNHQFIANQIKNLALPTCPYCNESKLVLDMDREGVREHYEDGSAMDLYYWGCPSCGHQVKLPLEASLAKEITQLIRNEVVSQEITEIDDQELHSYAKVHLVYSRIFYCLGLLCFMMLLYTIAFKDSTFFSYLPFLCVSIAFTIQALIRAYRYWQVINRHVFVENGFQIWLKQGKWIV